MIFRQQVLKDKNVINDFHVLVIALPRLSVFIALSIKAFVVHIRRWPPWTVSGVN